jgi:hypothetical protein
MATDHALQLVDVTALHEVIEDLQNAARAGVERGLRG